MSQEEHVIRKLGGTRLFAGYWLLIRCIRLAIEDEDRLIAPESNLYLAAAAESGCSLSRVKSNMDTLVRYCWKKASPAAWTEVAGCPVKDRPTLGEFIEIIAWYVRDHDEH